MFKVGRDAIGVVKDGVCGIRRMVDKESSDIGTLVEGRMRG